ncbi:multiple inositol polyphosphate phosphatase 1 [Procambarus clarkii]|uniref:multiple inositol polyphosphate phosphatase 1 n=1 Tax=Procambarus clarkii TaxID=6728 RepID=UPI001E67218D|nr:multiple inositol polyphosphate phosphatase 1-like [Procambarus clarkii]XP_045603683.1 multiple inositol polyphosphate phosphatase 1-like [Procambarus clarkii]XP_045603684.1 multiple inositol polyphosphate phosphatase 1-like [Procambarus clarkii]
MYKTLAQAVSFFSLLCCSSTSHICKGVEDEIPLNRLSTKTSYFNAEKDKSHWEKFNNEVWGCTAQQMWLLNRHGTRYPTKNDMGKLLSILPSMSQQIEANHQQGRGCLNQDDISQLGSWFPPYGPHDKEQLQEMGYDELTSIGEYWRDMFPHLFNVTYDPAKFKVEFTVKNRTGQSAYHFLKGMFGDDVVGNIEFPEPFSPNFILRFYKACPRWLREVYRNSETTYKERTLFTHSEVFQSVAHAVSARLGFMHPLKPGEIEAIYDECRYETAWWPSQKSAWCSAFSHYDFEVMEYHQDLKYYYEDSYGHPLNSKTACRTLCDLYNNFRMTISKGEAKPQGIFYFAHDKTIFKVLASMGLYHPPEHLRHDNFADLRSRKWRTSFISPFGANVAFVLYRCGLEYKIGTFFQGQPTPLTEHCQGTLCRLEEINPWLSESCETCDLSKLCMMHDEL